MDSQHRDIQGRLVHHSSHRKQAKREVLHFPTNEDAGGCSCRSSVTTMEGAGDARMSMVNDGGGGEEKDCGAVAVAVAAGDDAIASSMV